MSDITSNYMPLFMQPRPTRGPVKVFAVVQVAYVLTTYPYFDDLKCDIFDAGDPQ